MAGGYAATAGAKFRRLSGEPIPCSIPARCTVNQARPILAKWLGGGSLRLISESGRFLEGHDEIPEEGNVQVQVASIAPGAWFTLYSSAFAGFDEVALREALTQAWPGDGPQGDYEDVSRVRPEVRDWQDQCQQVLRQAVIQSAGEWADFWTFGQSADSYGYSYVRPPYRTMPPSVDLMVNDVKRWQELLLTLEDDFAQLRSRCGGLASCEHIETAVAFLLRHSPDFSTDVTWVIGFEMWYRPLATLVRWYLSSAGFEECDSDLLDCVDNAITGFGSYTVPKDAPVVVRQQAAKHLKLQVPEVNSTADWLRERAKLKISLQSPEPALECGDPHLDFIEAVDAPRSPGRAAKMKYALARCREAAGAPLEFRHLEEWREYILGHQVRKGFRQHDAYGKQSRERYPLEDKTEATFLSLLAEANTEEPIELRACRAYLDVLFFHPFDDGNSRLARLVFDFVLTRDGYTLQNVDPVFMFSKSAKDGEGALRLVEMVGKLLAKQRVDWDAPLKAWVAAHPHPGLSWQVNRWFCSHSFPEDVPP